MTLSIAGRCARTGMFGAVIASSSMAVAARCIRVRNGVGAACSQNITDPSLATSLLDELSSGAEAEHAMAAVTSGLENLEFRQLLVVDRNGKTSVFSGRESLGTYSSDAGRDCVAAGNLLSSIDVPGAMVRAFADRPDLHIGDRMIAALRAGRDAGGEAGPVHSAGMLLADRVPWPVTDIRVDWSEDDPVEELAALWARWTPLADAYVTRAIDPAAAPGFGVAGATYKEDARANPERK